MGGGGGVDIRISRSGGVANRVQKKIPAHQSFVDVPPELPKPPVDPPPKSPLLVLLFVLPKPVLPVEPKPVSREDSSKRWVRADVHIPQCLRCAIREGCEDEKERIMTYHLYSCLCSSLRIQIQSPIAAGCCSGRSHHRQILHRTPSWVSSSQKR
jgi:hypothetical protein